MEALGTSSRGVDLLPQRDQFEEDSARVRVATGVADVTDVASRIELHGDRYLRGVFTAHELRTCDEEPATRASRLAACFAAKEAVLRVLRPADLPPPWRSIEIRRHPDGWTDVHLSGVAASLAEDAGVVDLAVSITHDQDVAAAVVVALLSVDD